MALQEEFEQQGNFLFRHRGTLPIIILFVGIIIRVLESLSNPITTDWINPTTAELVYIGIAMFGLLLRAYIVGHAAKNTSGRNTSEGQIADTVNSTGMYSIVRHPLYVGNFFMWLGLAFLAGNNWFVFSFCLAYWIYYERIMFAEEQFLRKKFGEVYVNWSMKTPAFIPAFSKWVPSILEFRLNKAIRQEKTGFFLLTLCFFLFKEVQCYIETKQFLPLESFWVIFFIVGLASYALIKIMQKTIKSFNN